MTVRILLGDCREVLASLPPESIDCCVTSPPYWGLRSYLPESHPHKHLEIGSEASVDDWVATMVQVFRDVRRILKPHGTCWINMGDSYAGNRCTASEPLAAKRAMTASRRRDDAPIPRSDLATPGLKPKDLVGQPWRLAFALQQDGAADWKAVQTLQRVIDELVISYAGQPLPDRVRVTLERLNAEWRQAKGDSWWLRQDVIWHKLNPMPESVTDRCTKAHEYLFLLSRNQHYYFDAAAIAEPSSPDSHARAARGRSDSHSKVSPCAGRYRIPPGWATGTGMHDLKLGRYTEHRRACVPGHRTHSGAQAYERGDEHHRTKGGLVKYADRQRELASAGARMGRGAQCCELKPLPCKPYKGEAWHGEEVWERNGWGEGVGMYER